MLCHNKDAAKIISSVIPHQDFDSYYSQVAKEAESFFNRFGDVPGTHTLDIIQTLKAREPANAGIYDDLYFSLEKTWESGVNHHYALAEAFAFARKQRFKRGVTKMLEVAKLGTEEALDQAEDIMRDSFKKMDNLFDPGTNLADTKNSLKFLDTAEDDIFPTGIKEFDALRLGPTRGQLFVVMGLPNTGKSWAAIHFAKQAILHRKKTCYISLEMSEKSVCQRMIQACLSISKREKHLISQKLEVDDLGHSTGGWIEYAIKNRPTLQDENIRELLIEKIKQAEQMMKRFWVKRFSTGSLTIKKLDAYLDQMEAVNGVVFDEVIYDYPALFDYDPKNKRIEVGRINEQIRGIAIKRNHAAVSPYQSNRAGVKEKILKADNASEDFSINMTADIIMSHNQTESEYKLGLARLFTLKAREEVKNMTVLISQAYGLGQYCLDSALVTSKYYRAIEASEGQDEE